MIDTPDRDTPEGLPDEGQTFEDMINTTGPDPRSDSGRATDQRNVTTLPLASAVDAETMAKMAAIDDIVEQDLKRLKTVLTALADQLTAHLVQAQTGEVTPSEISGTAKHALPLVTMLINQEKKVDDQIKQRVGKAGSFAFDLDAARLEIGRRLTGLRRAEAGRRLPGGDV